MKNLTLLAAASAATLLTVSGCSKDPVETSEKPIGATLADKSDVNISDVPDGVLDVARAARPDVEFASAQREVRNGVVYYDVEGETAQGDEIELDIMQTDDGWRVVEVQRDIEWSAAPTPVQEALLAKLPNAQPARIIESDQTDGIIIYEFFFRSDSGEETKHEVKYDGDTAELLEEEWAH